MATATTHNNLYTSVFVTAIDYSEMPFNTFD